ncbi:RNaseH domain-containing protein [Streptomyces sp. NPDC060131]|uniref:RNaseH domain-containing protein n=1 Tax=unclassified Streptomyces TaxID=2593676 RepID=UPI0036548453
MGAVSEAVAAPLRDSRLGRGKRGAGDRGDDATTPAGGRPADRVGAEQRRQRETEGQTLAHQLRYHDDYPPLARPLPLHLARLADQYVLPVAGTKGERSAESGSDER